MSLVRRLTDYRAEYEKIIGRPVTPELLKVLTAMCKTADIFEKQGVKDARSGRAQRTKGVFEEWGRRCLRIKDVKDDPVVDLMYMCYLDGYNSQREGTK